MAEEIGTFKVEFAFLDSITGKPSAEGYITPIGMVGDEYEETPVEGGGVARVLVRSCPKVSNQEPYIGPLTQHEFDWLSGLPGREYNLRYRFTVTQV